MHTSITDPITPSGTAGATLTFYSRSRSHLVMARACSRVRGVEDRAAICAFYRIALRGARSPVVAFDLS
jgi:hypothetical protein